MEDMPAAGKLTEAASDFEQTISSSGVWRDLCWFIVVSSDVVALHGVVQIHCAVPDSSMCPSKEQCAVQCVPGPQQVEVYHPYVQVQPLPTVVTPSLQEALAPLLGPDDLWVQPRQMGIDVVLLAVLVPLCATASEVIAQPQAHKHTFASMHIRSCCSSATQFVAALLPDEAQQPSMLLMMPMQGLLSVRSGWRTLSRVSGGSRIGFAMLVGAPRGGIVLLLMTRVGAKLGEVRRN